MSSETEDIDRLEACLRSLVMYYLDNLMHSNAIFLCERLVACNPREENVLLLATCHFGESSELRAHALLQGCRLPQSRFLLATCCLKLNKPGELERVLLEGTGILQKGPKDSRAEIIADPCPIPFGAAGLRLLGLACQKFGRRESAEEYFRLSLELDPLMWVSIQSLCELGANFDVEKHFETFAEKVGRRGGHLSSTGGGGGGGGAVAGSLRRGAVRERSLPWAQYLHLQAPVGGHVNVGGISAAAAVASSRRDDLAREMPPPPPQTGARNASEFMASKMETPSRSRLLDTRNPSPVGGGALFGTPTPTQRRVGIGANASNTQGQPFTTPALRTPTSGAFDVRSHATAGGGRGGPRRGGRERAGGVSTRGRGGGGRSRSGRETSSSAVGRGKNGKRKEASAGAKVGAGAGGGAAAVSDGIGHLLNLGARLGTFFPPAVGPGPVPGLVQLLKDAPTVNASSMRGERPLAPPSATDGAVGTPAGKLRGIGGDDVGGRRFFATPGLTPIPTARTPGADVRDFHGWEGGGDGIGASGITAEDTPSMFLSEVLRSTPWRGDPRERGGAGADASLSKTPLGHLDGRPTEPVGMRAARMAAVGAESLALAGEAGSREAAAGGGEAGGGGDSGTDMAASSRAPRGVAGGRRVGGRLSFSSAVATDDASSMGSGGAPEGTTASRVPEKRRMATPGTGASVSVGARQQSSMRPPTAVAAAAAAAATPIAGSSATPASAALAGRTSRMSSTGGAAGAVGGNRAQRNSNSSAAPMDIDEGEAGARRSWKRNGSDFIGVGVGGSGNLNAHAAEKTPVAQNYRRPNTRAVSKRAGIGVGGVRQQMTAGSRAVTGKNGSADGEDMGEEGVVTSDSSEVRMTRKEWEQLQYEETWAFASKVVHRAALQGVVLDQRRGAAEAAGTSAGEGAGNKESDKARDKEKVLAALGMLEVVAQACARALADGETERERTSAPVLPPALEAGAGIWTAARRFPHQEGGRRDPGGNGGGGASGGAAGGNMSLEAGLRAVASLLVVLGKGYQHLMKFRCPEALEEFKRLPPSQFCTGWVLHQVGRAYFERADYAKAKSTLESMQQYDPHRLEGLDLLSTTLWHLKRDVELSYLAQKVSDFDRRSPYTWCVVGNCFSLQKEHETALRFFHRAIQLNPEMTYAYTLCGHEYVVNEDFDKAVSCFRMAIKTDRRHYNAWYGLGSIYHRQEKYDMAEYHFRRALSINPQSSVLQVYLGMVFHANKRYLDALDMLGKASKSQPSNPQASFQRANVLMSMERYEDALEELETVRNNVPKESAVYFLMGKVCKKLGMTNEAMRHFTIALDLHNKDKNLIKAAVDRLNEPDLAEEEKF